MLADLLYAQKYASQHRCTLVLVVPPSLYDDAITKLIALAGVQNLPFGGRSVHLKNDSLVTIRSVKEAPLAHCSFDVMFTGWGSSEETGGMDVWRQAANQVVARVA